MYDTGTLFRALLLLLLLSCSSVCLLCAVCRGVPVVEVNLEPTGNSRVTSLSIQGKAGQLLPVLFGVQDDPNVVAALAAAAGSGSKKS